VLVDRSSDVLSVADALAEGSGSAHPLVGDLSDVTALQELTRRIDAAHGGCNVLVNSRRAPKKDNSDKFEVGEIDVAGREDVRARRRRALLVDQGAPDRHDAHARGRGQTGQHPR
jgi:NAD(P)-dependent dehydrogenase (short-subunit alcohol dehydrogenase family)